MQYLFLITLFLIQTFLSEDQSSTKTIGGWKNSIEIILEEFKNPESLIRKSELLKESPEGTEFIIRQNILLIMPKILSSLKNEDYVIWLEDFYAILFDEEEELKNELIYIINETILQTKKREVKESIQQEIEDTFFCNLAKAILEKRYTTLFDENFNEEELEKTIEIARKELEESVLNEKINKSSISQLYQEILKQIEEKKKNLQNREQEEPKEEIQPPTENLQKSLLTKEEKALKKNQISKAIPQKITIIHQKENLPESSPREEDEVIEKTIEKIKNNIEKQKLFEKSTQESLERIIQNYTIIKEQVSQVNKKEGYPIQNFDSSNKEQYTEKIQDDRVKTSPSNEGVSQEKLENKTENTSLMDNGGSTNQIESVQKQIKDLANEIEEKAKQIKIITDEIQRYSFHQEVESLKLKWNFILNVINKKLDNIAI